MGPSYKDLVVDSVFEPCGRAYLADNLCIHTVGIIIIIIIIIIISADLFLRSW